MLKKLKKQKKKDYNWVGKYIKEYNERVLYYEKQLAEKNKIIDYLNTFDNLFCVGRNGQHRYNNMDHSMVTSFEAVKDIINGIHDKTNVWNVNTDKEYHETKEQ